VVRRHAVVGDRDQVVSRLAEVRERAAPDLFLLPVNDYGRAGEFVKEAAAVLGEAGFGAA
jgi:alkanesulfonate monooxygenase SsuD/methylene tetrahydromethanopterin reductase-like flavin-dependent oxidoreductase (luciferase family)